MLTLTNFFAKYCISDYVRVAFNFTFGANRIFSQNLKHVNFNQTLMVHGNQHIHTVKNR